MRFTGTGVTTVILTGGEVVETPPAVATALMAYAPAARLLAVKLKGGDKTDPKGVVLLRKVTLVTVPPLMLAVAPSSTFAGTEKTGVFGGLVRECLCRGSG